MRNAVIFVYRVWVHSTCAISVLSVRDEGEEDGHGSMSPFGVVTVLRVCFMKGIVWKSLSLKKQDMI